MASKRRCVTMLALVSALSVTAAQESAQNDPRKIGLVERSGSRLAQIDVTAVGPPELTSTLTAADLKIKVNLHTIGSFILDRLCALPEDATATEVATEDEFPRPRSALTLASYMFYFDQAHLTLQGRQRSITTTRQLIRDLIHNGSRGMLVSNGNELLVAQPLTDDPELLLGALHRLENDRKQFDTWATQEDYRVGHVVETLNDTSDVGGTVERAMGLARRYQMEETWRAEKAMRRLSMTLSRLSEPSPPKAVFYFADTMRANAGEHYVAFFGERLRRTSVALLNIENEAWMARSPFDKIIHEASAMGIRFYAIQPQGMISTLDNVMATGAAYNSTAAAPSTSRMRFQQANNTMFNLASETGGHAFVQGQRPSKIVEQVRSDFSCLYIASFDPVGLPQDAALRVKVESRRSGVTLHVRGQIVVKSESARNTSRLLNAFASPDGADNSDAFSVRANVVPTGYRNGSYTGLLQVSVPPLPLQGATWDLGASVIVREKVGTETSGRVSVPHPGVPVIFESEMPFKPGDYEIVSVAHETSTGLVSSYQLDLNWPDPRKQAVTVSPIAVLQPEKGAFMREDEARTSGSLARGAFETLRTDVATALVGLVCHSRKQKGPLQVQRTLVGDATVEFPPLTFDLDQDRCAQIRDLVPADSLGGGYYRYEIKVSSGEQVLDQGVREFFAASPDGELLP